MVFSGAKAGPSYMVEVGAVSALLSLQLLALEQFSHQGDPGAQGARGPLKFQFAAVQRFSICSIKVSGHKDCSADQVGGQREEGCQREQGGC